MPEVLLAFLRGLTDKQAGEVVDYFDTVEDAADCVIEAIIDAVALRHGYTGEED